MFTISSEYFYGNKISNYGIECGYVDYATLARAFNAVLNNGIMGIMENDGYYFDLVSGGVDNSERIEELNEELEKVEERIKNLKEIRDEYEEDSPLYEEYDNLIDDEISEETRIEEEIVDLEEGNGRIPEIFQYYIVDDNGAGILEECGEIVYYCETLDLYLWGVTHYGTSWDYVLTNIKIEKEVN